MSTNTAIRPEDRQRSGREGEPWADAWPVCFRSEAFAEDLDGLAEVAAQNPAPAGTEPRP